MSKPSVFYRLDFAQTDPLGGPVPAAMSLLRDIEARQHALMTGWSPGLCIDFNFSTGAGTTRTVTTRVPPDCTYIDLGVLAWGDGTLAITTSADAVGTQFRVATRQNEESAVWLWTSGVMSSSFGAESGRAVMARSSPSWIWSEVDLSVVFGSITSGLGVLAMVVVPLHLPV